MSHADWKSSCTQARIGVPLVFLLIALAYVLPAVAVASADHVLLAEIQTLNSTDTRRPLASEYIEIYNPTATAIDLSDYYLTDAIFAPGQQFYWKIADGTPSGSTAGGGAFADFHARFPAGYNIAAGDTVVIAVGGGSGAYEAAYGKLPDFEVYEDGLTPDEVPELLEAFPGSINAGLAGGSNTPTLSDGYESVVLYHWDGTSDLVQDVDFAFWGNSSTSSQFDKSGVTVGDATYADETPVANQQTIAGATLNPGQSYMRKSADEGTEISSGGNGIDGHDETSEPLGSTWEITTQDPARQPDTFFSAAPLITAHSVTPEHPYDGQEATLSVTAQPADAIAEVTFFVAYDGGSFSALTTSDEGSGQYSAIVPAQSEGTVVAWYAVVSNDAGSETFFPVGGESAAASWTVGAVPPPSNDPDKLLLSEICTLGTAQEFVEIYNPNDHDVNMSDYYVTDAVHNGDNPYWKLSLPNPENNVGGGAYNDFFARFPSGFTIAAGDTIVMSVAGSESYEASYGFAPEVELFEDGATPDNIMDMLPVWGDETNNSIRGDGSDPTLTNGGEAIVLLYWDGESDLVTDIDIFYWKDPSYTSDSFLVYKTGAVVGSSTYGPDTPTGSQTPFNTQLDFGSSYQRVDVSEGAQSGTNGNGIGGTDETSEDFNNTFEMLPADPSLPGITNPLAPTITLSSGSTVKPASGQAATMIVSVESPSTVTAVDFYYRVSAGEFNLVEGVETSAGNYAGTFPGQTFGTEVSWYVSVTNEGGYKANLPAAAPGATFNYTVGADPFGLIVEARTFIPKFDGAFPIKFNTQPNSETRLRIFDQQGRLVITLYDSRFGEDISETSGKFTKIFWDGRDDTFERVKAGMYIVHLSVVDKQTGDEKNWQAPVVVATRLSN